MNYKEDQRERERLMKPRPREVHTCVACGAIVSEKEKRSVFVSPGFIHRSCAAQPARRVNRTKSYWFQPPPTPYGFYNFTQSLRKKRQRQNKATNGV